MVVRYLSDLVARIELRCLFIAVLMLFPAASHAAQERASALKTRGYDSVGIRLPVQSEQDKDVASILHRNFPIVAQSDPASRKQDAQLGPGNARGVIAIVYPDLAEPYRSIFESIIAGIKDRVGADVMSFPIGDNVDTVQLNARCRRAGVKVVIALGRQGLQAASMFDSDMSIVVGGVISTPESDNRRLTGISLTPDPALLFTRLKTLMPGVKRVIVVYDPRRSDWVIKLARDAAKSIGVELVAHEAHDLAAAARIYKTVFANADGRKDAIWLPQDATTVDEGTILPLVLRESWNGGVTVFSSSFLHVKKGVLFALYPNNFGLGRSLAEEALDVLSGDSDSRGMLPLRDVSTAVNLRTASHIGLNIGYQQQRMFDSIFPEP
jgi:putative ABC transport system substrate-binding protein